MTTLGRLASGNLATIATMFVNVAAQLVLLPLFLKFWDAERYGLWLVLNATTSLLGLVDLTHQDYVGFECMRLPREDRAGRGRIMSDAVPVLAVIGVAELALLGVVLSSPLAGRVFHGASRPGLTQAFRLSLFGLMTVWVVSQNLAGTMGRVLASVGRFSIGAWWGVVIMVATSIVPAISVALGADFLGAAFALGLTTVGIDLLIYRNYLSILRREEIAFRHPNLRAGFRRYGRALVLAGAAILEYMQQAGFRIAVLPLLGVVQLVRFSALRTVANVAQQGVGTLVNPTAPELMRFIAGRDADRSAAVLAGMVFAAVILIAPGLVALQIVAQDFFTLWTLHKVPFDPPAFAILSATVLVYGLSQPSRTVVRGNNLVAAQAAVSAVAGVTLATAAVLATPRWGVLGAAVALLAAELVRSGANIAVAARWMARAGLPYPTRAMMGGAGTVAFTIATVLAMALFPGQRLWLALAYALCWPALTFAFWRSLDSGPQEVILTNLARVPHLGAWLQRLGWTQGGPALRPLA